MPMRSKGEAVAQMNLSRQEKIAITYDVIEPPKGKSLHGFTALFENCLSTDRVCFETSLNAIKNAGY
jgi:hypothetical protein